MTSISPSAVPPPPPQNAAPAPLLQNLRDAIVPIAEHLDLPDALALTRVCATPRQNLLSQTENARGVAMLRQKAAAYFSLNTRHLAAEGHPLALQLEHLLAATEALQAGEQPSVREGLDGPAITPIPQQTGGSVYLAPGGNHAILDSLWSCRQMFNLRDNAPPLDIHPNEAGHVALPRCWPVFSHDAQVAACSTLSLLDSQAEPTVHVRGPQFQRSATATCYAFLPNSHTLWLARHAQIGDDWGSLLQEWHSADGSLTPVAQLPGLAISSLALGHHGVKYAASTLAQLHLFERPSHAPICSLDGHEDAPRDIHHMHFSPDDSLLAVHTANGYLRLVSVEDDSVDVVLGGPDIHDASFSPDSVILAWGRSDHIVFYDTNEGRILSTLGGFNNLSSLAFSHTGHELRVADATGVKTVLFTNDPM